MYNNYMHFIGEEIVIDVYGKNTTFTGIYFALRNYNKNAEKKFEFKPLNNNAKNSFFSSISNSFVTNSNFVTKFAAAA